MRGLRGPTTGTARAARTLRQQQRGTPSSVLIHRHAAGLGRGRSDLIIAYTADQPATIGSGSSEGTGGLNPTPAGGPDAALAPEAPAAAAKQEPLALLKSAQPVDRLRYQALLLFEHFDADHDGLLSADELAAFFTYSGRKLMWSPGLSSVLKGVQDAAVASLGSGACSRHQFSQLVRDQVHAVSCSLEYQRNDMRPDDAARLQAQMGLTHQEVCAAKWVFTLLDYNADGKLSLADVEQAAGIERHYYEAQLQDADTDDDGALVFEEFLLSYAKPRPVWKNLVIMAANTAAIFLLLQSPLDVMLKVVLVGALILRPQIVSRPACYVYDGVVALAAAGRARAAVASREGEGGGSNGRGSVWRTA